MSIPINVDVKGKRFTLDLYEDRGLGGDHWVITEKSTVPIPNDEVAAFTLSGDVGVHVEFFNDATKPKDSETWAEATLTVPGEILVVGNMRYNTGGYTHHKHPKHDNIDGKVSKIIVTQET